MAEFVINNQINKTIGISLFFANYGYKPCSDVEPMSPQLSALFIHAKKGYLQANAITNHFKRILTQFKALTCISQ